MNIPRFSVRNSVLVNWVMIFMILAGLFSLSRLPRELMPDIEMNWVFIVTVYPGVSPEEIEDLVTKPIEDAIEDVDKIINKIFITTHYQITKAIELFEGDPSHMEEINELKKAVTKQ